MTIPLINSTIGVIIDDADAPLVSQYQWSLVKKRQKYYAHAKNKQGRGRIYMHRLLMGHPVNQVVDHIHGETIKHPETGQVLDLNNQRSNLRICTRSQNMGNSKQHSDRAGKYKGVYLEKSTGKYVAQICINHKSRKIGRYKTALEAAYAYDAMAILEFGEYALVNLPNEQPAQTNP